jgi:hypothetical protein
VEVAGGEGQRRSFFLMDCGGEVEVAGGEGPAPVFSSPHRRRRRSGDGQR